MVALEACDEVQTLSHPLVACSLVVTAVAEKKLSSGSQTDCKMPEADLQNIYRNVIALRVQLWRYI